MEELDPLAFDVHGRGPAVVLIHGHPFDRSMWREQVGPLAERFRVVMPDLRGYGESAPVGDVRSMAQLAGDVWALLDTLGVERPHVVGLSMGGLVAMEMTIARPGAVRTLGLVATTAEPVTEEERARRLALADEVERTGMDPLVRAMHPRLFGPGVAPATARRFRGMMAANDPAGSAAALRGRAGRPDHRPALRAFPGPAFVCTGTHDLWSTAEVTAQLVACLRDPTTLELEGVGHLPNVEAPEPFNAALLAFLDRAG